MPLIIAVMSDHKQCSFTKITIMLVWFMNWCNKVSETENLTVQAKY